MHLFERQKDRHQERGWFTPHMVATAWAGPGLKPGATRVAGTQPVRVLSPALRLCIIRSRSWELSLAGHFAVEHECSSQAWYAPA